MFANKYLRYKDAKGIRTVTMTSKVTQRDCQHLETGNKEHLPLASSRVKVGVFNKMCNTAGLRHL